MFVLGNYKFWFSVKTNKKDRLNNFRFVLFGDRLENQNITVIENGFFEDSGSVNRFQCVL